MEPASIRYNNPGAMWGGAHANKWGATNDIVLKDGQANHIAVFPTRVQGGAAQFDLWRKAYTGMSLSAAIKKWCGGNSPAAYVGFLEKNAGISGSEIITSDLLAGPRGLALMKAQATWEAGKPYPMTPAEWTNAQALVFAKAAPKPVPAKPHAPAAGAVVIGTAAAMFSWDWRFALAAFALGLLAAFIIYKMRK